MSSNPVRCITYEPCPYHGNSTHFNCDVSISLYSCINNIMYLTWYYLYIGCLYLYLYIYAYICSGWDYKSTSQFTHHHFRGRQVRDDWGSYQKNVSRNFRAFTQLKRSNQQDSSNKKDVNNFISDSVLTN